jgi:CRP-like cAMP-binding protein
MPSLVEVLEQLERGEALDAIWAGAGPLGVRTVEDQALYHEGDPSDAVYLLLEGRLIGLLSTPDDGIDQPSLFLEAPALVGDREILFDLPAQETIACLSACRILTFAREELLAAFQEPEVSARLSLDLAARHASHLQVAWLQRQNITRRLAHLLPLLGSDAPADRLAKHLRANPKTVQRALKALRDEPILVDPLPLPFFHRLGKRPGSNTFETTPKTEI